MFTLFTVQIGFDFRGPLPTGPFVYIKRINKEATINIRSFIWKSISVPNDWKSRSVLNIGSLIKNPSLITIICYENNEIAYRV